MQSRKNGGHALARLNDENPQRPIRMRIAINSGPSGADMVSLQFPGVPVPIELTAALTDKWLLITPSPQAATVARSTAWCATWTRA